MGVNRPRPSGTPRRASYPSGPWIDGIRPPGYDVDSRSNFQAPPAAPTESSAGAGNPNPNPHNYRFVKVKEIDDGKFLVLLLHYPDCTNYEGNKILLFKDTTLIELINQRFIDPHFFTDQQLKSPIARFVPTDEGWRMAISLVETLCLQQHQQQQQNNPSSPRSTP